MSFCNYFGQGLDLSVHQNKLVMKPCCLYDFNDDMENTEQGAVWKVPIDDITKNTLVQKLQKYIIHSAEQNKKQKGCWVCIEQDSSGIGSLRKKSFEYDNKQAKIHSLTLEADYRCNLACAICGPKHSSTWYAQADPRNKPHYYSSTAFKHSKAYVPIRQTIIESVLDLDLSNLQWVKIAGGEPLYSDSHIQVIKGITDRCDPKKISLTYTTNFSVLPNEETLSLWKKFKRIEFSASIDGVGDQFHFLRWPYRFDKLKKNIKKLQEICGSNTVFKIEHTLNPLNILDTDKMIGFITNTLPSNKFGDRTEFNMHSCHGVELALQNTPLDLREAVYKKYGKEHKISRILQNTAHTDNNREVINYLDNIPVARQLDWRNIFPEAQKYFI